jgi:prophage regulatory protein
VLSHEDLRDRGIKYSRQHIHRLIKRGLFPRPVKIGAGTNAWLENEIDQYLQDRSAERDAKAAPSCASMPVQAPGGRRGSWRRSAAPEA